jgi:3-isopropylmalate/(R)-2-methylmalate dehydratase small subunit
VPPVDDTPPAWEEPLPTLRGRAWAFGMGLAATDVLPERFATASPTDARRHLFGDLDRSLAAALAPGDVLVAEEHHGGDATAGPALAALAAAGVIALAGRRFDPALERAAHAAGVVILALEAPGFIHTGDRLRIDLEDGKIVNLSSGDRAAIRNLTDAYRTALRAMLGSRGEAS